MRPGGTPRRLWRSAVRAALALAVLLGAGLTVGTAGAAGIPCGSFYTVAAGDTLYALSMATYGRGLARVLFAANSDVLTDIKKLPPGTQIWLPCLDGSTPRTRLEALSAGLDKAPAPAVAKDGAAVPQPTAPLRLVTGSDFAPFAHQDLPEGGMTVELVRLALAEAEPGREVQIEFVEDWASHADLIRQRRFDLGFPWYRPDCDRADRLDEAMRRRCADFDFSDPLFEVQTGYYVQSGAALDGATSYDALAGKRLCRPAGYFTFDLDQQDLKPPRVTRVIPPGAGDCFVWLDKGEVDVVTLNRSVAELAIARLGLTGRVAELPALATRQTLHVVAAKSNPDGEATLADIDKGLAGLRESGRWFEVVSQHLGSFGLTLH